MYQCYVCNRERVVWGGDFDAEDYGFPDGGVVSNYTCSNCGAYIEVYQINEDENERVDQ